MISLWNQEIFRDKASFIRIYQINMEPNLQSFLDSTKEDPLKAIHTYFIIKKFLSLDFNIKELAAYCLKKGTTIFNGMGGNDNLRWQYRAVCSKFQKQFHIDKIVSEMKKFLKNSEFEKVRYRIEPSLLMSLPGCAEQPIHSDYNVLTIDDFHKSNKSFIALYSMMDQTKFVVKTESETITLLLNKGELLLARGTLLHAGASYEELNVRIHFYIDPLVRKRGKRHKMKLGIERPQDKTYLYMPETNPNPV